MTTWTARVEWQLRGVDDVEQHLLAVHAAIPDQHGAAVGLEPLPADPATASAHLTVEAGTLRQALDEALRVVRAAVHDAGASFTPAGVEVLPADVHDERDAQPRIPELVGHADVARILGVSRQRAGQLAKERRDFPPAVTEVTGAGPLRLRSAVEEWAKKPRIPGRHADL